LNRASEYSFAAGRIRRAAAQFARAVELQSGIKNAISDILGSAVRAAEAIGVSDDASESVITLASDVLHRHGYFGVHSSALVLESDALPIIAYSLTIPSVGEMRRLNVELAHSLADSNVTLTNLVARLVEATSADDDIPTEWLSYAKTQVGLASEAARRSAASRA
jgi:hypothetical protein